LDVDLDGRVLDAVVVSAIAIPLSKNSLVRLMPWADDAETAARRGGLAAEAGTRSRHPPVVANCWQQDLDAGRQRN
jgi:hypothetical protein